MNEHSTFALETTLTALLEGKKYASLRDVLSTMNPSDIAAVFDKMEQDSLPLLFRLLPKALAADTFVEMDPDSQELLIRGFSDSELREVLDELYVDDAVDIVEEMPANVVQRILAAAAPDMRKDINNLLNYPENSAGSIMTTEYVSLRTTMTVGDAITHIRRTGVDKETIYTCYVTSERTLVGTVSVKTLLLARDDTELITDVMEPNVISVTTQTDKEEVAQMLSKYHFLALPVVDTETRIVGIITFDDAMDVMEEEATEDIEIMGGMTPSDKTYLKSSPIDLFKHRIPWLLLLMVSATFTGMILNVFEEKLRIVAARVIWKEIRTAVLCGVVVSVACFGKIMLVDHLLMRNPDVTPLVGVVVCLTMVVTICVAKLIGCTLPMIAKKLGFDPAVMASPFITTIVDAVSLLVYFGIATVLLHM